MLGGFPSFNDPVETFPPCGIYLWGRVATGKSPQRLLSLATIERKIARTERLIKHMQVDIHGGADYVARLTNKKPPMDLPYYLTLWGN